MNLFITHASPVLSAQYLDDKRVVNQIRETAQMLCTSLIVRGCNDARLMAPTHRNHPVTLWVGKTKANWSWTFRHFEAPAAEKQRRWPDNPPHKNFVELQPVLPGLADQTFLDHPGCLVGFQNCARRSDLGIDFTHIPSVPTAYRLYMAERWKTDARPPRFSNTSPPPWCHL